MSESQARSADRQPPTMTIPLGNLVRTSSRRRDVDADQVLDPDARLALEVDAGLDREHRRARELDLGGALAQAGQLVGREADPVAGAVAELVAAAGGDRSRRGPVRPPPDRRQWTPAATAAPNPAIAADCARRTSS